MKGKNMETVPLSGVSDLALRVIDRAPEAASALFKEAARSHMASGNQDAAAKALGVAAYARRLADLRRSTAGTPVVKAKK